MSSTISRNVARQAVKFQKQNNPFMTAEKAEQASASERDNHLLDPIVAEEISQQQQQQESDFSIKNFFRMNWSQRLSPSNESLDRMLIRNIRILMEEEKNRQIAFERMCQTRLNY